ncbi:MAG: hypothetical protein U1E50_07830 [Caulobacteraceae bacterium]
MTNTPAHIVSAEIVAGHDGEAELALSIRYENGVVGHVTLDPETGLDVMQACGVNDLAGLTGAHWRDIQRRLEADADL